MKTKEIILCHFCNGSGRFLEDVRINAYESDYIQRICSKCKPLLLNHISQQKNDFKEKFYDRINNCMFNL